MSAKRTNSFFGGTAILAAGILIVKVISAVYKMPLVNILRSSGYADFSAAFNTFNIMLMISTAGIPVAMSKMISQALEQDRPAQVRKIFRDVYKRQARFWTFRARHRAGRDRATASRD